MNNSTISLRCNHEHQGFTLVEMAIVLVIIGLLLGSILMPLSAQIENNKRKTTQQALEDIKEALVGFALANDRLPCPATPGTAGAEDPVGGGGAAGCTRQHGFIPASTLGLSGGRNRDGLLMDVWNNPIRYSVTTSNAFAFTRSLQMKTVTMPVLAPDLKICSTTIGSTPTNCAGVATTLASNAVALIYSMGKDWADLPVSAEQQENRGANLGGGPSGINYPIASDIVFVDRDYSTSAGAEFDDIVTWLSPNILYNRMVAGGRLP